MALFGKFQLLEQIGGGRLSQVFRVTRQASTGGGEPRIALKRVQPTVIGEAAFVQLVVREGGLLARLSHPNLCLCHEMGVVDGCAFLTLDLVEGCTLRALMRRTSRMGVELPSSSIIAIGHQLARALGYLHHECSMPLVHLDLSPQNVMLDHDGALKLIDFGIARYLDGRNPPPLGGKIAGTVGYMSPEQASGRTVDARADQFGLGILLWEMLAGQRAFRGNTPETWHRMRAGQMPSTRVDAASDLVEIVTRLLQPSPADRFASMTQVTEQLESLTSDPLSGMRPLCALVTHLLKDPGFDPFDVVRRESTAVEPPADIPSGADPVAAGYAELSIEVDHGEGTPGSLVRAAVTGEVDLPDSPFLETIVEAQATAQIAR
ncbi:MAG: hypothetical protein COW56_09605 [Rhodocyclales bacterium CG17_big_fil_post_rev_8_21_14_2_50_68_7]|nr:MAG: hypothetical protein COW56_09605 [Rhodocyclales bacterium CG17_big_fil_post_rev_8_21_14_2_50_68_7]